MSAECTPLLSPNLAMQDRMTVNSKVILVRGFGKFKLRQLLPCQASIPAEESISLLQCNCFKVFPSYESNCFTVFPSYKSNCFKAFPSYESNCFTVFPSYESNCFKAFPSYFSTIHFLNIYFLKYY